MRKLIVFVLLLISLPRVFADTSSHTLSYSIALHYDSGNFSLKSIDLVEVTSPIEREDGGYKAKIVSFRGELLHETSFNVNVNRFYGLPVSKETVQGGSSSTSTNSSVNLLLPYYPHAKTLQIMNNEELLLEADLSMFSTCNQNNLCDGSESIETCASDCTCGNNVCEPQEHYMSCSSDCRSGQPDGICDQVADNLCDPDCAAKEDFDCKEHSGFMVYGVILIVTLIVIFFGIRSRNHKTIRGRAF